MITCFGKLWSTVMVLCYIESVPELQWIFETRSYIEILMIFKNTYVRKTIKLSVIFEKGFEILQFWFEMITLIISIIFLKLPTSFELQLSINDWQPIQQFPSVLRCYLIYWCILLASAHSKSNNSSEMNSDRSYELAKERDYSDWWLVH